MNHQEAREHLRFLAEHLRTVADGLDNAAEGKDWYISLLPAFFTEAAYGGAHLSYYVNPERWKAIRAMIDEVKARNPSPVPTV